MPKRHGIVRLQFLLLNRRLVRRFFFADVRGEHVKYAHVLPAVLVAVATWELRGRDFGSFRRDANMTDLRISQSIDRGERLTLPISCYGQSASGNTSTTTVREFAFQCLANAGESGRLPLSAACPDLLLSSIASAISRQMCLLHQRNQLLSVSTRVARRKADSMMVRGNRRIFAFAGGSRFTGAACNQ